MGPGAVTLGGNRTVTVAASTLTVGCRRRRRQRLQPDQARPGDPDRSPAPPPTRGGTTVQGLLGSSGVGGLTSISPSPARPVSCSRFAADAQRRPTDGQGLGVGPDQQLDHPDPRPPRSWPAGKIARARAHQHGVQHRGGDHAQPGRQSVDPSTTTPPCWPTSPAATARSWARPFRRSRPPRFRPPAPSAPTWWSRTPPAGLRDRRRQQPILPLRRGRHLARTPATTRRPTSRLPPALTMSTGGTVRHELADVDRRRGSPTFDLGGQTLALTSGGLMAYTGANSWFTVSDGVLTTASSSGLILQASTGGSRSTRPWPIAPR